MDNIVIENTSPEMGAKIIDFFKKRKIDTRDWEGTCYRGEHTHYYYGVINRKFNNYSLREIKKCNPEIKILTQIPSDSHEDYQIF